MQPSEMKLQEFYEINGECDYPDGNNRVLCIYVGDTWSRVVDPSGEVDEFLMEIDAKHLPGCDGWDWNPPQSTDRASEADRGDKLESHAVGDLPVGSEKFDLRIVKLVIAPKGEPLFSEAATSVEIDDEAAGEFVKVTQQDGSMNVSKSITIDPDEWPLIRDAVNAMVGRCRDHN